LGKPPENITLKDIYAKLHERASEAQKKLKAGRIELDPIFTGLLSEKQWEQLKALQEDFQNEYKVRRTMLLKRLDVTIESFHVNYKLFTYYVIFT